MNRIRECVQKDSCAGRLAIAIAAVIVLAAGSICGAAGNLPAAARTEHGTRFAVIGHLYPVLKDAAVMNAIYKRINAARCDYVFILGDSGLEGDGVAETFVRNLQGKVYFAPGNHEVASPARRKAYLRAVGYLDKVVIAGDCQFVLVNSCESAANINTFLSTELPKISSEKLTILFAHHRIWDDTLLSSGPYQHDKSYLFREIYPQLQGRVQYIFSGNSKRQYFRDLETSPNYGKQNVNNVYWCDRVGDIQCISAGMGDGRPKAGFVVAEVVGDKLLITAESVLTQGEDPVAESLIQPTRPSRRPIAPGSVRPLRSRAAPRQDEGSCAGWKYAALGVAAGIVVGLATCWLAKRRRKGAAGREDAR